MNFNDNPLLVAPRPVRLTPAYPHSSRSLKIAHCDDTDNTDEQQQQQQKHARIIVTDKDIASPRASPRSSLPSEALEEFLAILRPAILTPSSPVLRPRRNGALAFGVAYKARPKIDPSLARSDQPAPADDPDPNRRTPTCSPEPVADHLPGNWDIFGPDITSRWHAQVLASPISRLQTRNPFPRHAAHEIALSPIRSSPTTITTPISPAAVPLPTPSPDESLEVF